MVNINASRQYVYHLKSPHPKKSKVQYKTPSRKLKSFEKYNYFYMNFKNQNIPENNINLCFFGVPNYVLYTFNLTDFKANHSME